MQHDRLGCLRRFEMTGHATGAPFGENPVCAAATALARTAARVLDEVPAVEIRGVAEREGRLRMEVASYTREASNYLKGVSDYLLVGVRDLEREYPEQVAVVVEDFVETEGE
ncbi:MAG: ribosomal-processing cysteine protease Prp [Spirochaetaceae bacterium]